MTIKYKICTNRDCVLAGKSQPAHMFNVDKRRCDGLHNWCKPCVARESHICMRRRREQRTKLGLCVQCGKQPPRPGKKLCAICATKISKISTKSRITLRIEVMSHYCKGTPRCTCCNETEILFLDIDHINGGGAKHRKQVGDCSTAICRWLKNHGYPEGFQVLCSNCNAGKARSGGVCPHKNKKKHR